MKPQELLDFRHRAVSHHRVLQQLAIQGKEIRDSGIAARLGIELADPSSLYPPDSLWGPPDASTPERWYQRANKAVSFWWEDTMLALALASPLPAGYTVPEPPYPDCFFGWQGSDPGAFASLFLIDGYPPRLIAPMDNMRERFPAWSGTIEDIAKLLIFLASPYVTTTFERPHGKAALRRTQHEGVHFVTLRTPKSNPKAALKTSTAIDWQYRWQVRGHYRNQWYPSRASHETIWIAAYVKGPADKPIHEPIYRVAR